MLYFIDLSMEKPNTESFFFAMPFFLGDPQHQPAI